MKHFKEQFVNHFPILFFSIFIYSVIQLLFYPLHTHPTPTSNPNLRHQMPTAAIKCRCWQSSLSLSLSSLLPKVGRGGGLWRRRSGCRRDGQAGDDGEGRGSCWRGLISLRYKTPLIRFPILHLLIFCFTAHTISFKVSAMAPC